MKNRYIWLIFSSIVIYFSVSLFIDERDKTLNKLMARSEIVKIYARNIVILMNEIVDADDYFRPNPEVDKSTRAEYIKKEIIEVEKNIESIGLYDNQEWVKKISVHLDSLKKLVENKNYSSYELMVTVEKLKNTASEFSYTEYKKAYEYQKNIYMYGKTRDAVIIILLLTVLTFSIVRNTKMKENSKKILNYLGQLSNRDYKFEIKNGKNELFSDTCEKISELRNSMMTFDNILNVLMQGYDLKETINIIFVNKEIRKYIQFNKIGFTVINDGKIVSAMAFSESEKVHVLPGFSVEIENSGLEELLNKKEVTVINDLREYSQENPKAELISNLIKEGFKSCMIVPLIKKDNDIVGFLNFSSFKKGNFTELEKLRVTAFAESFTYIFEKNLLVEDLVANSALSFVKLVEGKDPETGGHVERMAHYSKAIAEKLANGRYKGILNLWEVEKIEKFAPLHDIGKVGVRDSVLLKPGKLDDDEFEEIKQHTLIGGNVLKSYQDRLSKYSRDFMGMGCDIAMYHHEKWDGTGYPEGLKGEAIPLAARIVAVADVFDALSSKRVYKPAMSIEESIEIINKMAGKHFDPVVVEAFNSSLGEIKNYYQMYSEE